jgi:hypothetical protein
LPFPPPNFKKSKKISHHSNIKHSLTVPVRVFLKNVFLLLFNLLTLLTLLMLLTPPYSTYSFLQCPYALDEVLSNHTLLSSLFDRASFSCVKESFVTKVLIAFIFTFLGISFRTQFL